MPGKNILPIALALALAAPVAASAQSAKSGPATQPGVTASNFSVQGGLLFTSFSIDDEDQGEAGGGAGWDIKGRFSRDRYSIALGLERTTHDVEDVKDDLAHRVFYVEPRMTFPQLLAGSSQKLLPYASARVGRSKYAIEADDVDYEASGWLYGLGGGVLYELNQSTQLDLGLSWSHAGFGDQEADGDEIDDSDFGANIVALRVGVSYRFGMSAQKSARKR